MKHFDIIRYNQFFFVTLRYFLWKWRKKRDLCDYFDVLNFNVELSSNRIAERDVRKTCSCVYATVVIASACDTPCYRLCRRTRHNQDDDDGDDDFCLT